MHKSVAVFCILWSAGSIACAGSGGTFNAVCDTLATVRCDRTDACSGGFANSVLYGSINTCMTLEARHCSATHPVLDANDTPDIIDQCAVSISETSCDVYVDGPTSAACSLPGGRALGAGCFTDLQCAAGHCAVAVGSACGVCTNPPIVGGPCTATTGFACAGGALCNKSAGVCAAPGNVGTACTDANVMCGYGLGCTGESETCTCQVLANLLGASCDANSVTAPTCDASYGLACSVATRTCVAAVRALEGEACGRAEGGEQVLCAPAMACVYATDASAQGVCTARVPLGGACTPPTATAEGAPCMFPGVCVKGGIAGSAICQEVLSAACP